MKRPIEFLHMDDPQFADKLTAAIGATPGDTVQIMTPQFTRIDDIKPTRPIVAFEDLSTLPEHTLKEIGCQKWNEPDESGNVLWLVPGEWYDHIPEGTPMICIDGSRETFRRGVTDDDTRFGCLAYGFLRNVKEPRP